MSTTITEELRVAIREFKGHINSFNFVINHKEPELPIGSVESYQAQLELANEYLKKHPELNSEEFNIIGMPLYVKNVVSRNIEREQLLQKHMPPRKTENDLLWEAYMILDHGDHDERLAMLDELEKYFDEVGKPTTRS